MLANIVSVVSVLLRALGKNVELLWVVVQGMMRQALCRISHGAA